MDFQHLFDLCWNGPGFSYPSVFLLYSFECSIGTNELELEIIVTVGQLSIDGPSKSVGYPCV